MTVAEIFETMEYGPAPESTAQAQQWLDERNRAFGPFIDGAFQPVGDDGNGPYKLKLSLIESRLVFEVTRENGEPVITHILSLTPFRRIVKDYYMICDSYYEAIKMSTPGQIETIDMARRGVHNDGSQTLMDRLSGKLDMDFDTARRLFTLICVLQLRTGL